MTEGAPTIKSFEEKQREEIRRPKKIPREKRAKKLGEENLLAHIEAEEYSIEQALQTAYPHSDEKQLDDIVERIAPRLIELAELARGLADSYRKYEVGVVVLALRKNPKPGESRWFVRADANTKPATKEQLKDEQLRKEGRPLPIRRKKKIINNKWCGEQYNLDAVDKVRNPKKFTPVERVLALVIVGDPQPDHRSGIKQPTLSPCDECRDRLVEMTHDPDPVVSPRTHIITARAGQTWTQKWMPVDHLHRYHKEHATFEA